MPSYDLETKIFSLGSEQDPDVQEAMTFRNWLANTNQIKPGTFIVLGENDGNMTESFVIGDCTPYMQPSNNDGCMGWDDSHPRFDEWVLEVHIPEIVYSKPRF